MVQVLSWNMVAGNIRPNWAGAVLISDNVPGGGNVIAVKNPRRVQGVVVPVVTKSRGSKVPSPLSAQATGRAYKTDKGHMMALELGGPDESANIAPQSNIWQQSGGWRAIELNALDLAMEWMGIADKYDPADVIPSPPSGHAAWFSVAPLGIGTLHHGEPSYYEGFVQKIPINPTTGPVFGRPIDDLAIFQIRPGEVWWKRGERISHYKDD